MQAIGNRISFEFGNRVTRTHCYYYLHSSKKIRTLGGHIKFPIHFIKPSPRCLFWSIALLHRQQKLKIVGTVGVIATVAPIVAIIIGHIVVGIGAAIGVEALLSATDGGAPSDISFVTMVERIFGLWGYLAAWLLWRGHIVDKPAAQ